MKTLSNVGSRDRFAGSFASGIRPSLVRAEYDRSKATHVGRKAHQKSQLENPHGWLYIDAKDSQGKVVNWALELPGPGVLRRNGFDQNIFETLRTSGEVVTITRLRRQGRIQARAWRKSDESRRANRDSIATRRRVRPRPAARPGLSPHSFLPANRLTAVRADRGIPGPL